MDKNTLKEMLMLYGAEISNWPEKEQREAQKMLVEDMELYQLVEECKSVENGMLQRPILKENPVFVQNIIALAAAEQTAGDAAVRLMKQQGNVEDSRSKLRGFVAELLAIFVLPKPAYALMACAVLGFCLGMMSSDIVPVNVVGVGKNVKNATENGVEFSYFDALSGGSDARDMVDGFDMGDWL